MCDTCVDLTEPYAIMLCFGGGGASESLRLAGRWALPLRALRCRCLSTRRPWPFHSLPPLRRGRFQTDGLSSPLAAETLPFGIRSASRPSPSWTLTHAVGAGQRAGAQRAHVGSLSSMPQKVRVACAGQHGRSGLSPKPRAALRQRDLAPSIANAQVLLADEPEEEGWAEGRAQRRSFSNLPDVGWKELKR